MTPEQARARAQARMRLQQQQTTPTKSFFTQQGKGGIADYLPEGVTNAIGNVAQGSDDMQRVIVDSMTRHLADKALDTAHDFGLGAGGNVSDTQAARNRLPGWAETTGDIVGGVIGAPYNISSRGYGALAGFGEGALNEWGHQKNWIPSSLKEVGQIGASGLEGAGLGYLGSYVGEKAGQLYNKFWGKKPRFPDEGSLYKKADRLDKKGSTTPYAEDTLRRSKVMKEAELANAQGPEGYKKMLEGMNRPLTPVEQGNMFFGGKDPRLSMTHDEKVLATKAAYPPEEKTKNLLQKTGKFISGGNWWGAIPVAAATKGIAPMAGAGLDLIGELQGSGAGKAAYNALRDSLLDPTNAGLKNQAIVDRARRLLSQTMVQGGNSTRPF